MALNVLGGAGMSSPRLLLGDDHRLLLEDIRKALASRFEIAGMAADGEKLVAEAERLRPDVVVLDIGLPLLNGIDSARRIRQLVPGAKLVVLTQHSDKAYIREAFRAGASAYVLKQSATTELLPAIDAALVGNFYISRDLLPAHGGFDPRVNPAKAFGPSLSARQRDVLALLAQGKSNHQIAAAMRVTLKTVEFHEEAIMDELGLKTREDLARYASEHAAGPAGG